MTQSLILITQEAFGDFLGALVIAGKRVDILALDDDARKKILELLQKTNKPPQLLKERRSERDRVYVYTSVAEDDARYPAALVSEITRQGMTAFLLTEEQAAVFNMLFNSPLRKDEKTKIICTLPWWGTKEIRGVTNALEKMSAELRKIEETKERRLTDVERRAMALWQKAIARERERIEKLKKE